MAGYLGTLFMANVGMRLLLPPKGEYTKAAGAFGQMIDKIQGRQKSYFRAASVNNIKSLRETLDKSKSLAKEYTRKNSQDTMSELKNNLDQIEGITKRSISKFTGAKTYAGRAAANITKISNSMATPGRFKGAHKTFAKEYAKDLALIENELKKIAIAQEAAAESAAKAHREMRELANTIWGTFRGAIMTSITMLTTLGYSIRGVAQDFQTFERELINANSIWQESNEVLYDISDRVVKFGEEYGIAYDNASRVLYQFASAGLEAAEAQAVLNDVLILSMAVQGDANTIGKLTVQTIKGFGLEMSDAGEVTDKFAHSINASLIEYQDLASAIKFALPFYAATNQDLDQLLGSIQILSDRALEAGIAGRGLRQALAEFAEGAEDSTRKFAEMGVEVTDAQGNFLQLTEIARNFADAVGNEIANDTELLTTLIEDLNIRGATAFIHLVQNVDEFETAVAELANSHGAAAKMADVQQNSLAMMTQKMRNAMKEVFFLSDATFVAQGYMNEFDMEVKNLVQDFTELFLVEMPDGTKQLTDFSYDLRDLVIVTLKEFGELMETLVKQLIQMTQGGFGLAEMARALFIPLNMLAWILDKTSNILGTGLDANGLIFKFYGLSMVFGSTAAAAIMVGDAIAYVINMAEGIGDIVGAIIMVAATLYTGGGAALATRGAAAAGGRTAAATGAKNVFKAPMRNRIGLGGGKGYADDLSAHMTKKGYPDAARMAEVRRRGYGDLTWDGDVYGSYVFGSPAPQRRYFMSDPTRRPTALHRAGYTKTMEWTDKGLAMNKDLMMFADDYARAAGRQRMLYGAAGIYGGYGARYGIPTAGEFQSGYSPMMAQMETSSMQTGGGQDLYINNAYVESNNFQDLFYNADQLGG
tara:strand:- start:4634 stop:7255 length:2622 start_codon:yes stop_codon:yes gene_type:complete